MYRKMIATTALVAALTPAAAMAQSGWYVHGGVNATTVEQSTTRNTGTNEPNVGPAADRASQPSPRTPVPVSMSLAVMSSHRSRMPSLVLRPIMPMKRQRRRTSTTSK